MHEIVRVLPVRDAFRVAVLVAAATVFSSAASADASPGCAAVNRGALKMDVRAGSDASRAATLAEGETLALSVATKGEAAVRLTAGAGAPRTLASGTATTLVFVATKSDTYDFRLTAETAAATLSARCMTAAQAATERALLDRRNAFLSQREPEGIRIDRRSQKPLEGTVGEDVTKGATPTDVTVSVSTSEIAEAMKIGSKKKDPGLLDFWFEGRYQTYEYYENLRPSDGNFSVMYFGSRTMLGPDIMFGALAQFDQTGETGTGTGSVSASGWMAGPYMSVRFGPGIMFDGRAAWGLAERLPGGVMIDNSSAERRLVRGTLRGAREIGGWTLEPSVGFSYVQDTPALEDVALAEGGSSAPSGTGRIDVLPEVKRRFKLDGGTYIEPRFAAGGFLSFDDMSRAAPISLADTSDLHWKAEAGMALGKTDSLNIEATGGVETGSETTPDNWMGRLQLNMPFGK